MDNATYDEVNLAPINTDETYSRLRATETKIKPRYESQRTEDIDHHALKGVKPTNIKEPSNNFKFNTVIIIMIVILLLVMLVSIVLSVTTFNRIASEQSKVLSQIKNTNNDIMSTLAHQFQINTSQNIMELVETQLITAQNNISKYFNQLDAKLESSISLLTQYLNVQTQMYCSGPGLWHRFVYLNMSDPSQQCPSAWREYNTNGVRACGRPLNSPGSCVATSYMTGKTYSRVCGRVIGFQYATPDAFTKVAQNDIDLDGVNITYGTQRNHIWSYVAGETQNTSSQLKTKCPCFADNGQEMNPLPSVNNFYCESGNPDLQAARNHLYIDDPLWDGQQCEGTCCNGTMSPPWFSVQLPAPTTDAIEVSICCDQSTGDEDVPVELIEIYVQ